MGSKTKLSPNFKNNEEQPIQNNSRSGSENTSEEESASSKFSGHKIKKIIEHQSIQNPVLLTQINWEEYNYPHCYPLIHLNLKEIHPEIRSTFE